MAVEDNVRGAPDVVRVDNAPSLLRRAMGDVELVKHDRLGELHLHSGSSCSTAGALQSDVRRIELRVLQKPAGNGGKLRTISANWQK